MLREYLDWVKEDSRDLESVGDFVALAAQLLRLKARVLLPQREIEMEDLMDEDEFSLEGLSVDLDGEYKTFKRLAQEMCMMENTVLQYYARPSAPVEFDDDDGVEVSLGELLRALTTVVQRVRTSSYEISLEEVDLKAKMEEISKILSAQGRVLFEDLFTQQTSRIEIIITFMAILELVKLRRAAVRQKRLFDKIWVHGKSGETTDRPHR